MLTEQHSQSLTDFRQKAVETLDRLNRTGEAEIITVDGEPRAVLLSPVTYDELAREVELSQDAKTIRRSVQQIDAGDGQEVKSFFADLREKLVAMKTNAEQGTPK